MLPDRVSNPGPLTYESSGVVPLFPGILLLLKVPLLTFAHPVIVCMPFKAEILLHLIQAIT